MPKCKHQNIKLNSVIERWVNAVMADGASYDHQIIHDAPVALYIPHTPRHGDRQC